MSLARTILSIAECAYERNDPKGAHFGCPRERRKVRELAARGLLAITSDERVEMYARITNPGLTALDKLRSGPVDQSGNPSQPSPSGVSYTHPADQIDSEG